MDSDLDYLQQQLRRLGGTEGNRGQIDLKREEITAFLAGRDPQTLTDDDREAYNNLMEELDLLNTKRQELQDLVDNYDLLTSEEARSQELEKIDDIIRAREEIGSVNQNRENFMQSLRIGSAGSARYTGEIRMRANVDMTIAVARQIARRNGTPANVNINTVGRRTSTGDPLEATKQIITKRSVSIG